MTSRIGEMNKYLTTIFTDFLRRNSQIAILTRPQMISSKAGNPAFNIVKKKSTINFYYIHFSRIRKNFYLMMFMNHLEAKSDVLKKKTKQSDFPQRFIGHYLLKKKKVKKKPL